MLIRVHFHIVSAADAAVAEEGKESLGETVAENKGQGGENHHLCPHIFSPLGNLFHDGVGQACILHKVAQARGE